jgi:hypothetical protein
MRMTSQPASQPAYGVNVRKEKERKKNEVIKEYL